ncbi:hypothetical protein C2E23DRAFT_516590 [Lenzites betulinus]|nr:hypothetical protein C2E23DRAFT_516590 [Lenzites betulinus]
MLPYYCARGGPGRRTPSTPLHMSVDPSALPRRHLCCIAYHRARPSRAINEDSKKERQKERKKESSARIAKLQWSYS